MTQITNHHSACECPRTAHGREVSSDITSRRAAAPIWRSRAQAETDVNINDEITSTRISPHQIWRIGRASARMDGPNIITRTIRAPPRPPLASVPHMERHGTTRSEVGSRARRQTRVDALLRGLHLRPPRGPSRSSVGRGQRYRRADGWRRPEPPAPAEDRPTLTGALGV